MKNLHTSIMDSNFIVTITDLKKKKYFDYMKYQMF
jgi:hypothetical protein